MSRASENFKKDVANLRAICRKGGFLSAACHHSRNWGSRRLADCTAAGLWLGASGRAFQRLRSKQPYPANPQR